MLDVAKWHLPLETRLEPRESDTVEILKAARRRIAIAWSRERDDDQGGVCPYIAIIRAGGWTHAETLLGRADEVCGYFCAAIGHPYIIEWNYTPGLTQADVVAAFDRAIDLARRGVRVDRHGQPLRAPSFWSLLFGGA